MEKQNRNNWNTCSASEVGYDENLSMEIGASKKKK